jgi:hypothetical protein
MRWNTKWIFILLWAVASWGQTRADEAVTFTAEAPRTVVMGQQFSLVYTSNAEIKDLRIPEITDFEILMGPSTSTMSSTTIINGKISSSTTYRFTYILYPKTPGTYTIPPATATIKKDTYKSNGLTIRVLPSDKSGSAGSSSSSSGPSSAGSIAGSSSGATSVNAEQLFIRAIPSKTSVYEQEPVTITYKLYTRVDVEGLENFKFPDFKGFMAQEVELPANPQWDLENYQGLNYRTVVLKQSVLFPQETGKLTIDRGNFDVIVRLQVSSPRRGSIFDDFFDTYQDVKKSVYSNPVSIQVKPLPAGKPADFCGVAGHLTLSSALTSSRVKANEAVTLKLTLSGSGNLKLIPTPEISFPADFETYDPKVNNTFKVSAKGLNGTKTIEYLIIPRYAGKFTIPAVSLSYFNLTTQRYETLTTQPF